MSTSKPRSEAQIAASRANGAKSKGPKTAEGKARSSMNALKHGLRAHFTPERFADCCVISVEDRPRFIDLYDFFLIEHQPKSATEYCLVQNLVASHWRKDRIWHLQTYALERDMAYQPKHLDDGQKALNSMRTGEMTTASPETLLRYESTLDREFHRALHKLLAMRDVVPRNELPVEPPPDFEFDECAVPTDFAPSDVAPTGPTTPAAPSEEREDLLNGRTVEDLHPEIPVWQPEPQVSVNPFLHEPTQQVVENTVPPLNQPTAQPELSNVPLPLGGSYDPRPEGNGLSAC